MVSKTDEGGGKTSFQVSSIVVVVKPDGVVGAMVSDEGWSSTLMEHPTLNMNIPVMGFRILCNINIRPGYLTSILYLYSFLNFSRDRQGQFLNKREKK